MIARGTMMYSGDIQRMGHLAQDTFRTSLLEQNYCYHAVVHVDSVKCESRNY